MYVNELSQFPCGKNRCLEMYRRYKLINATGWPEAFGLKPQKCFYQLFCSTALGTGFNTSVSSISQSLESFIFLKF